MTGPVWDGRGTDPWLPARLNARLNAAQHERSIRNAFWASLSGWLVTTGRRVLRTGQRPDLDAVWARVPAWRTAVDHLVNGQIREAVGAAYRSLLGEDYAFGDRPFVTNYLAEATNRLVRLPDEVYDLMAGQVSQGVESGEGIPAIAHRVEQVLSGTASERWPNRATVVARSETIGALNAGRHDAFQAWAVEEEPEAELQSMWISTLDTRTRPTHRAADLQRVPVGTPFTVGGFKLRFPGDPTGPPQECIQCRCTTVLVEAGEEVDLSDRQMKR